MRKAGEIFKQRQESYRQRRRDTRQRHQDRQDKTRLDQRNQRKEARAGGASREELQTMRKEHRTQRQDNRNSYRKYRQYDANRHRSNMKNDRMLDRHFNSGEQGGYGASVVTNYRDNKTGKTVRTPSSAYQPKNSKRFTKIEPPQMSGGPVTRGGERNFSRPSFKGLNNLGPNSFG